MAIKTFLISLKKEPRRRSKITKDLSRLKLDYEIFDAVDGYLLPDNELARLCDLEEIKKNESWYSKGMIGCALSHYYLYKKIVELGLPYAFIIEDDARLPANISELLAHTEKHLMSNEVILFYYQSIRGVCEISAVNSIVLSRKNSINYPISPNKLSTTGAYIITREACLSMISAIQPIRKGPDDWQFFYENGLKNIRVVYPRPVETYDFRSTLSNLSNFQNKSLLARGIDFVNKYRIFPFYQVLAYRRRHKKRGIGGDFELTQHVSPVYERNRVDSTEPGESKTILRKVNE